VSANLPYAWTASRWAEPDKCTLAEFIPACGLCADCLPIAAEPHGQLNVLACVSLRHLPLGPEFINRHIGQTCGNESGFQLERGIEIGPVTVTGLLAS